MELVTVVDPPGWTPRIGDVFETDDTIHGERRRFFVVTVRDPAPGPAEMNTRYVARDFNGVTWNFDDPARSSREAIRVVPRDEWSLYERVVVAQLCFDDTDLRIAEAEGCGPSPLDTMEGQMLAEFLGGYDAPELEGDHPGSLAELIEWVATKLDTGMGALRRADRWRTCTPGMFGYDALAELRHRVGRAEAALAALDEVTDLVPDGWELLTHQPDDTAVWLAWRHPETQRGLIIHRHGEQAADPNWPSITPDPAHWTSQAHLAAHHGKPTNAKFDTARAAFEAALDILAANPG